MALSPWRTAALAVTSAVLAVWPAGCTGAARSRPASPAGWPLTVAPAGGVAVDVGDVVGGCQAANATVGSQVEPSLAASPRDPRLLVAIWQQDRFTAAAALGIAVAVSRDSARTWSVRHLPDGWPTAVSSTSSPRPTG